MPFVGDWARAGILLVAPHRVLAASAVVVVLAWEREKVFVEPAAARPSAGGTLEAARLWILGYIILPARSPSGVSV